MRRLRWLFGMYVVKNSITTAPEFRLILRLFRISKAVIFYMYFINVATVRRSEVSRDIGNCIKLTIQ